MARRRRYKRIVGAESIQKTNKKAKEYKSVKNYINSFYQKNKNYIDTHIRAEWIEAYGTPKKAFQKLVEEKMSYTKFGTDRKYTVDEAIKRELNSKDMNPDWTASDVYSRNFLQKIKKDRDLRREITLKSPEEKKIIYERAVYGVDEKGNKIKVGSKVIQRLKEKASPDKVKFMGYYNVDGTNAIVYSYDDDTYIIEYKSPKKGAGATFDVMTKEFFDMILDNGRAFKMRNSRER